MSAGRWEVISNKVAAPGRAKVIPGHDIERGYVLTSDYWADELCHRLNRLEADFAAARVLIEDAKECVASLSAHVPDAFAEQRLEAGAMTERLAAWLWDTSKAWTNE